MKKIVKSFATVTTLSVLTRLLSMLCKIFLARRLSSYELGIYQSGLSVFAIALTVISSGFPLAVSRFFASGERGKRALFASSVLCFSVSLVICCFVFASKNALSSFFADEKSLFALKALLPAIISSSLYCSLRGALWGKERFFFFSFSELFEEIAYVLCVLILFRKASHLSFYIPCYAIVISSAASCVFAFIAYFATGGNVEFAKKADYRAVASVSLPIISVRLLASVATVSITLVSPTRLVLSGLKKSEALSLIGVFSGVITPLLFAPSAIVGSLCLVLLPKIAKNSSDNKKTALYALAFCSVLAALIAALYFSLSLELCEGVFGKKNCDGLLKFSCIAILPMSVNQISGSLLNSLGLEKKALTSFFFGAAASLATVFFFSPVLSIFANALAVALQGSVAGLLNLLHLKKRLRFSFRELFLALSPFSLVFILGTVGVVAEKLFLGLPPVATIAFSGLVVLATFLLIAFAVIPKELRPFGPSGK